MFSNPTVLQNYPLQTGELQTIEFGINGTMTLGKNVLKIVKEKSEEKIIPDVEHTTRKTPKCFESYYIKSHF